MKLAAVPLLLLAACDAGTAGDPQPSAGVATPCALAGSAEFTDACTVVRSSQAGRTLLTLNAPDGGFRRLAVAADGGEIGTADGADQASVERSQGGEVLISIADDRYRLPAAGE